MWNKISRLFAKTSTSPDEPETFPEDNAMDRDAERRRIAPQDLDSSQDTYDTRQTPRYRKSSTSLTSPDELAGVDTVMSTGVSLDLAVAKQRASVRWLLSKSYNNKVPENLREPFYRDHEEQEHLKPQVVHQLANAELYCLALANVYSDPNYHHLNHTSLVSTLVRKGALPPAAQDSQLTETTLIQTTPLKMSAHMQVMEALMALYAKEVATPDRVVAAVSRFTQSGHADSSPVPPDTERALLHWVNGACAALRRRAQQDLEHLGHDPEMAPDFRVARELSDLCDGVGMAALVSLYCPAELPWERIQSPALPSIAQAAHNVAMVRDFCQRTLPAPLFHMAAEDVTYMRGSMRGNLVVFLADLFNVLEIHPVTCVRFPAHDRALADASPRNSQGVVHKRSLPMAMSGIPDLRSDYESHSAFTGTLPSTVNIVSMSKPISTTLPVKRYSPSSSAPGNHDGSFSQDDSAFVVHRGKAVPTLSSVVREEEPLVPARLRPSKERTAVPDSKFEERGEAAAAGRPSHWEDTRKTSYAGRRSRRNSITAEDSQLTIENFGGSQEHLNFVGRNPDKEVGGHIGRKDSVPAAATRSSAQDSRSSGVELIFRDEKRDEEKMVSRRASHDQDDHFQNDDHDLGRKVATSFAELSRLKDGGGTYTRKTHVLMMEQEDADPPPPPRTFLGKKPGVAATNGDRKTTTFAALPTNTTTWQQQQQTLSSTTEPAALTAAAEAGSEDSAAMAAQLVNIRMKLEEKRRRIEGEKRRMEVVMNKQRQKVGKAAFLQAVAKGKTKPEEAEGGKEGETSPRPPQRPFSLQEISEDASTVQHKWLDSTAPFVEERKTPDIESMDLEQYQQSISQMNSSLHDIQSDIQRLSSQQSQIQDLSSQRSALQDLATQRTTMHELATQQAAMVAQTQQQMNSLVAQQQHMASLAYQQQALNLAQQALVHGPGQFYLHEPASGAVAGPPPSARRTWATPPPMGTPPSMATLPHEMAYPHPPPAEPRVVGWPDQSHAGFTLHEPTHFAQHGAGDARYQNGDSHHSLGHYPVSNGPMGNGGGGSNGPMASLGSSPGGFQLHPEPGSSPGGYSSRSSLDRGSSPSCYSPPPAASESPRPVPPPRHQYQHLDRGSSTITHAPLPAPPLDDMEPQSISFIGKPTVEDTATSGLSAGIKGLQITSGSRTYRIPSPTRPTIARHSFAEPAAEFAEADTEEKGFYVSFDNDPAPLRPKPPLRTKRMSPKKERAASTYDDIPRRSYVDNDYTAESRKSESLFGEQRKVDSLFGEQRKADSLFGEQRKYTSPFAKESSPFGERFVERQATPERLESRESYEPVTRASQSSRLEQSPPYQGLAARLEPASAGVGLVIGSELLNPEPSIVEDMERKKERIMLLSLQRRQQLEEQKQAKEAEAERRREDEKFKQEERERRKEEERERRQAILEQHKLKKAIEEAEREGKVLPAKSDFSTLKAAPKLRGRGGGARPRPKTIHVDSAGADALDAALSPGRASGSKKGSTSNLAEPGFSAGSRREMYRGSQDNLAETRSRASRSLFARDSPDDGRGTSPSRGNTLGRRGSYKNSRDTSEPRRVNSLRPNKYPSYQGGPSTTFRGRKSNSLMNLSGSSTDQDSSLAYRYGDTDSGLGRATPPRRAPSPGLMRHLPSPSGPGSLPPGLVARRRGFDDNASDISSNPSSMMDYNGPRLYKQPSSKSNRPIILNAVEYCVFPGVVNREAKRRVLEEIARSESKHFLILFRDAGCQFRALYSFCPDREEVAKLYGTGPKQVSERMFDRFFKYNSGGKCFSQIHTKHLTVTIDAFTIHNSLWQGKKVSLPSKKDMVLVI